MVATIPLGMAAPPRASPKPCGSPPSPPPSPAWSRAARTPPTGPVVFREVDPERPCQPPPRTA
eukprot:9477684-Pyramimonas_sp.AAC.1